MSSKAKPAKKRPVIFALPLIILIPLAVIFFGNQARDFSKYDYEIVRTIHHEPDAYTQGLLIHDGVMYESTGQYGASSLRKLDPQTGEVHKRINLPSSYFAEGLAYRDGKLYQLTYRENTLFIYDAASFEQLGTRSYQGEGWGLTYDGKHFIMSNGSGQLTFRNPDSFDIVRSVDVFHRGHRVTNLNELEYIDGKVWANVYTTKDIVVIDPKTGNVERRFVFRRLPRAEERNGREDAFNGIAYDPEQDRVFVTGKYFSKMYELKLIPSKDAK